MATPQDQTQQLPPGLMDALMGGGGAPPGPAAPPDQAEPDTIQVGGGGAENGQADDPSQHLQDAIDSAQAALQGEPDSAASAKLAKIVQELYAVQAEIQDSHMSAMGANPKDMWAMHRANGYGQ